MKMWMAVASGLAAASAVSASSGNMNGEYIIQSGAKQGVQYNDDYASRGQKYFDVWAPEIATKYAQVFWTSQGTLPLPPDLVKQFEGKVIAITGYEQDQVMVTPTGKPGVNPDQDVSVPINWAYNHHYMTWMAGSASEFVEVPSDGYGDWMAHGATTKIVAVEKESAKSRNFKDVPTSQFFSEGNGGESRKSYHGYPAGYAQLLESPSTWTITPMQIDTRNRACGVTPASIGNCTQFTPGPEPKQARYAFGTPEGTNYSGILECPCNGNYGGDPSLYGADTKTKQVVPGYASVTSTCATSSAIANAQACYDAAAKYLGTNTVATKNVTVSDDTLPSACTFERDVSDGSVTVAYNTATSTTTCAPSSHVYGETHFEESGVTLTVEQQLDPSTTSFTHSAKGLYCADNHNNVLAVFKMTSSATSDAQAQLAKCEAFCKDSAECSACSVDCPGSLTQCQWVAIPECGAQYKWAGIIPGDISTKKESGSVKITMTGPADAWFAVGFNAHYMKDQPYTLIANSSGVVEQKLGTCGSEADHCPGTDLAASVDVISNDVSGSSRTVVVTRALTGATSDHFSFDPAQPTIDMISAVGSSQTFAYHKAHSSGQITTMDVGGAPSCLCDAGPQGKLCMGNGTDCSTFTKGCLSEAQGGDLLQQHNPTCNSVQYAGGLQCCHHNRVMLDEDQLDCEGCDELLRYHMKFRFWYEEYTPANATHNASHQNLKRYYWQTEADAGEYDIPPAFPKKDVPIPGYPDWPADQPTPGTVCSGTCPDGPDCECYHEITFRWNSPGMRLIYAGGHCHAPSCISLELFRNDTGKLELLCGQYPVYGSGNVSHDKFDEAGYLVLPPCLWGDEGELEPSQALPAGTPLVSIKRNRNTHVGHFGEMASWQMRGVAA